MRDFIKISIGFLRNVSTTGAIVESSSQTQEELTTFVNKNTPQVIVEFGAGTGVVTRRILEKMHHLSVLHSFEINDNFAEKIGQIQDRRLHFHHRSADDVDEVISAPSSVDLIISTVPITILPAELVRSLTVKGKALLKNGGHFSQLVFSPIYKRHFKQYFGNCRIVSCLNMPPAFIHHATKND